MLYGSEGLKVCETIKLTNKPHEKTGHFQPHWKSIDRAFAGWFRVPAAQGRDNPH